MGTKNLKSMRIIRAGASPAPFQVTVSFVNGAVIERQFGNLPAVWAWLKRFDLPSIVTAEVVGGGR